MGKLLQKMALKKQTLEEIKKYIKISLLANILYFSFLLIMDSNSALYLTALTMAILLADNNLSRDKK